MTSLPPDKNELVNLAKLDLANRLKIDPAQITLSRTVEITWPDISAGCSSNPGQILSKGRVYGYRVWLEALELNTYITLRKVVGSSHVRKQIPARTTRYS